LQLLSPTVWENGYSSCHETVRTYRQWLRDHAIKFARWQHPAMGHRAKSAVPGKTCFVIHITSSCQTHEALNLFPKIIINILPKNKSKDYWYDATKFRVHFNESNLCNEDRLDQTATHIKQPTEIYTAEQCFCLRRVTTLVHVKWLTGDNFIVHFT